MKKFKLKETEIHAIRDNKLTIIRAYGRTVVQWYKGDTGVACSAIANTPRLYWKVKVLKVERFYKSTLGGNVLQYNKYTLEVEQTSCEITAKEYKTRANTEVHPRRAMSAAMGSVPKMLQGQPGRGKSAFVKAALQKEQQPRKEVLEILFRVKHSVFGLMTRADADKVIDYVTNVEPKLK